MFKVTVGKLSPFNFATANEIAVFLHEVYDLDISDTLKQVRQMKKGCPEIIATEHEIITIENA